MNTLFDFSKVEQVLCLGAHCDDIEIGAGGLLMRLIQQNPSISIHCVVLTGGNSARAQETQNALKLITKGAKHCKVEVHNFKDAHLPSQISDIKQVFEQIKEAVSPDLILSHYAQDKHQDHRVVNELTWNTWRNHTILEYEILKWDGDLGQPNTYVTIEKDILIKKIDAIYDSFISQRDKTWFNKETLQAIMRVRGVESNAEYAEAFYARKLVY